jgi:hypothetical protein
MSLGDLDELVISCRTEEARSYVSEAVACYKAGAFRACIVAAWIAVVFDLLAKIRELALGGDREAQRITNEVAALQPRAESGDHGAIRLMLEIERDVVDIANDKFGFFEGQQVVDLRRLHDDRNRCAHPTYQGTDQPYSPSAELGRAHLVHAVRHVLAVRPVQGRAATAHLIRLVESKFFPTEVSKAKVQLRSGGMDHPKESLVRSVIDHLVFGLFEGSNALKSEHRTIAALQATHELFPGICEPRIRKAINLLGRRIPDDDLTIFFVLQKCFPQTWGFLEPDNQTRLTELIRQSPDDLAILLIPICFEIDGLGEICRARTEALGYQPLGLLLQESKHPMAIARAVDIYCSSRNFTQANSHYRHVLEPILTELDQTQIRRILLAPADEGADLIGAHSFSNFIRYVRDEDRMPLADLVAILSANNMEHLIPRAKEERPTDGAVPFRFPG